jgi:hypothetical protein
MLKISKKLRKVEKKCWQITKNMVIYQLPDNIIKQIYVTTILPKSQELAELADR